jgi:hypothetical protein
MPKLHLTIPPIIDKKEEWNIIKDKCSKLNFG